ncbi:MAG: DUF2924 domain-containing protein [Methylovirgula sp.]
MLPAALDLDQELARIASLNKDELRALWRQVKGQEPPDALSKDLIARALAHRLQEEHFGGLNAQLRKQIATFATGVVEPARYVKTGSIIIREYQGRVHEVMVVPAGFLWQDQIYASLSTIARKITGTHWNGPRFFGLRGKNEDRVEEPDADGKARAPELKSPPVASSVRIGGPKRSQASKRQQQMFMAGKDSVSRSTARAARLASLAIESGGDQ